VTELRAEHKNKVVPNPTINDQPTEQKEKKQIRDAQNRPEKLNPLSNTHGSKKNRGHSNSSRTEGPRIPTSPIIKQQDHGKGGERGKKVSFFAQECKK